MNDAGHHIHRRGRAIARLRSVTTGAAVAGIAGTVGFGALAAATWAGDPNAAGVANGAGNGTGNGTGNGSASIGVRNPSRDEEGGNGGSDDGGAFFGTEPGGAFGSVPNAGANQNPTFIRPAQPGTHSHATTGGSH